MNDQMLRDATRAWANGKREQKKARLPPAALPAPMRLGRRYFTFNFFSFATNSLALDPS
jgi:hypothetical protein